MYSLRTRITLIVMTILVTSIFVLAYDLARSLRASLVKSVSEQQYSMVSLLAADINRELRARLNALEKIAGSVSSVSPNATPALQSLLEAQQHYLAMFNGGINVLDAEGTVVADAPRSRGRIGVNYMSRSHVAAALKEGKSGVGAPTMGIKLATPILPMAVPVRDARGKVTGAVTGTIDLGAAHFLKDLVESRYGISGGYLIVSRLHRVIVAASDTKRVLEASPAPGRFPLIDRYLQGHEGTDVFVNPVGVEVIQSSRGIPAADWYIAAQWPTTEAFAPLLATLHRFGYVALFVTLLAGALAWSLLKRQLRPLNDVAETLSQLSESREFPQSIQVNQPAEIGKVVKAFNQLLAVLDRRNEALRESEQQFSSLVRDISGFVYRCANDPDWTISFISAGCREITGYDPSDLVGNRVTSLGAIIHPEDAELIFQRCQAKLAAKESCSNEYRIIRRSGEIRWIWDQANGIYGENGDILAIVGLITDITERKLGERDRGQLAAIVEYSNDAIMSRSLDGIILTWNAGAERMLGYTAAEAIGKCSDILVPPHRIPNRVEVTNALLSGSTVIRESDRLTKDGREIEVRSSHSPIRDSAGNVIASSVILQDITLHKRALRMVRENEQRMRLATEATGVGIWEWNISAGKVLWDTQMFRIYGIAPTEDGYVDYSIWRNAVLPEYLSQQEQIMQDTIRTAGRSVREFPIRRAVDGALRHIAAVETVRTDPEGRVEWVVGTNLDITERKASESEINQIKNRMSAIIDAAMDAIITVDENERVVVFNLAAERIFKVSAEEVMGQSFDQFVPERLRNRHRGYLREFKKSEGGVREMGRNVRRVMALRSDGTEFPIEASISYVLVNEQSLFTVTLRDVTLMAQAEAARAHLEAQLRESQKMEAIGTLAGGIAHDFNNALATILGNAELARQDSAHNPPALESLEEIRKAGTRARNLVQQILAFGRRQPTERKVIDLLPVVTETARLLRATLPARLKLEVHCAPAQSVLADASQIEQMLINLATNAMQAMRNGTGRIDIRLDSLLLDAALAEVPLAVAALRNRQFERGAVRITVSDNGCGMDAATKERLFEPFFTTKPAGEGTGLGLSVVHGIVQGHEGAIIVDSEPGKGSTFTIYLPAVEAEFRTRPLREYVPPAPGSDRSLHILYLDDDDALVFLVERLLQRRGYRVAAHSRQEAALQALRAAPAAFDLVVTDYNMPGMSGLDIAREVRMINPNLPVIVTSGFVDEELQAGADSAGVRELIFKADDVEVFCETVERLVHSVQRKAS
mgnify:CR=1 FL=1